MIELTTNCFDASVFIEFNWGLLRHPLVVHVQSLCLVLGGGRDAEVQQFGAALLPDQDDEDTGDAEADVGQHPEHALGHPVHREHLGSDLRGFLRADAIFDGTCSDPSMFTKSAKFGAKPTLKIIDKIYRNA